VSTAARPSGSQGCRLKALASFADRARYASRSKAILRLETVAAGRPSLAVSLRSILVSLLPNKLLQLPAAPPRLLLRPACRPWLITTGSVGSTASALISGCGRS